MKRVLTFLAILLLPLSLWAMTPVSDSDLSNVTGQAGVNINADLTMDLGMGTLAWGDADGINQSPLNPWADNASTGGYVGVNNFNLYNLRIRARTETNDHYNGYNTLFLKPITIDVATGGATGPAWLNGRTFVRIGLGALQISMNALSLDVALGTRTTTTNGTDGLTAAGLNQVMGSANIGAMEVYINPWSYVDIYATRGTAGQGVSFDMSVKLDSIAFGYMSWGDDDGTNGNGGIWMTEADQAAGSGGFVGLRNFEILGHAVDSTHLLGSNYAVDITGTVAIDVATSSAGIYSDLEYVMTYLNDNVLPAGYVASEAATLAALQSAGAVNASGAPNVTLAQLAGAYALDLANSPSRSVVHISFPNVWYAAATSTTDEILNDIGFRVKVGKIVGNVALGSEADMAVSPANDQILGDIYIQGVDLMIHQGSWVDIWAH